MDYRESLPKKRPFAAFPDIDAFFPAAAILRARQKVFRSLNRGEGVSMVFGDAGVGKTLLTRLLASQFEMEAPVIALSGYRFPDRKTFWSRILFELNGDTSGNECDLRLRLLEYFRRSEYGRFFLLIDDAERLPLFVFDELRSVLDFSSRDDVRVRIALFGTPSLEERLLHPKLARFTQRIVVREWLEPFNRTETEKYIAARTAACETIPFTREGARRVHQLCDGIPRLINQVADLALWFGPTAGKTPGMIDECVVQHSWESLQQISGAEREPDCGEEPSESLPAGSAAGNFEERDCPAPADLVEFGSLDDEDGLDDLSDNDNFRDNRDRADEADHTVEEVDEDTEVTVPVRVGTSRGESGAVPSSDGAPSSDRVEPSLSLSIYTDSETVRSVELPNRDESWEDEEPLDEEEGPIDPELERRLRERLSRRENAPAQEERLERALRCDRPRENNSGLDSRNSQTCCLPFGGALEDIPSQRRTYLEELRLLELEVEQEAALIRKIREMQSGLSSFHLNHEDESRRREGKEDSTGGTFE